MSVFFFSYDDVQMLTLLSLLVSLLHGHQRGEVGLIVGQDQGGAVTAARGHLQGQIEPSERDGGERWKSVRTPYVVSEPVVHPTVLCMMEGKMLVYLLLLSL